MKLKSITIWNDLRICILALLFLTFIAGTVAGEFNITFISDTPADCESVNRTYADINTSITNATSNSTAFIDWNNSVIGWWRFNNESVENSTFFRDWSSWGNNASCSNCPVSTNGTFGNATRFDGSTDYVNTSTTIASFANGTMEAWIKPANLTPSTNSYVMGGSSSNGDDINVTYALFVKNTVCPTLSWGTVIGNGTSSQLVCSGQLYNSSNFSIGVWKHLAITYNGSNVSFYADGVLINVTAQILNASGNVQPYSIGRLGAYPGAYFNGTIDEVRIHNRALSAEEINASYNATINQLHNNFTGLGYGNYNYTAYAQNETGNISQATRTLTLAAAEETNGTDLVNISELSQTVSESVNATYIFSLRNNGTLTDNYSISTSNPDTAENASLNITLLMIESGATEYFTLNVSNTTAGTFRVNVTANSTNDPTKIGYLNTTTTVNALGNGTKLTNVTALTLTVSAGVTATYTITLENNGSSTDNYSISVLNLDNAENASLNISSPRMIESGAKLYFTLNVSNTTAGTFHVNVTANSTNEVARVSYVNTTTIVTAVIVPPVITIVNPANNSVNTTGYVNVTATLSDDGIAQYLNWDGVNYSMTPATEQDAGTVFYRNMPGLLSGDHTFRIFGNNSGASNTSETGVVTVNRTTETSIADSINTTTFIVNDTIEISAPSGNVTVTIPNGTNASVGGSAITNISMDSLAQVNSTYVSVLGNNTLIGENLSAGPEGARFSPDIQIRFNYTDAQLTAAGITESQLRIKFYNTTSGTWVEQTPYTINTTGNFITANVSHFSTFALAAEVTEAGAPSITGFAPSASVTDTVGASRTFNITVDQTVNVSWYLNGTLLSNTSTGVTTANYTNASASAGTWNVTARVNNSNGTDSKQWTWSASDTILTLNSGWNLVSVPFSLSNTRPFTGFTVLTYNASAAIPVSDPAIEPLKSYWVNNSGNETTVALFKATADGSSGGSGAPTKSISLANGWNMVGPTGNVSMNASLMFGSMGLNLWRVASYLSLIDAYVIFTNSDTAVNKVSDLVTEPTVGYWAFVTRDSMY